MNDIHWKFSENGSQIARDRLEGGEIVAVIPPIKSILFPQSVKIKSPWWIESRFDPFEFDDVDEAARQHAEVLLSIRDYLHIPPVVKQGINWKRISDGAFGDPGYVRQYDSCAAYVARAWWKNNSWYYFDGATINGFFATAEEAMLACDSKNQRR